MIVRSIVPFYQDKSAIFRLNVNADGINLTGATNAAGQTLGTATLTDTLPDGWEFVDIVSGSKYLIFEGVGQSNGTVLAILKSGQDKISEKSSAPSDPSPFGFTRGADYYGRGRE